MRLNLEVWEKTVKFALKKNAIIAQLVERRLPKPKVAGSSPVYRSIASEARQCASPLSGRARDYLPLDDAQVMRTKIWGCVV